MAPRELPPKTFGIDVAFTLNENEMDVSLNSFSGKTRDREYDVFEAIRNFLWAAFLGNLSGRTGY